jgi:bifunctional oligoribonuclease and PAP phosphatase NrnA
MDPFDQAVALLAECDEPVLLAHVHPDGDALGSMLAMHLLCEAQGKRPMSSWGGPFPVAPHYRFLPGLDRTVLPRALPRTPEVAVTFDCGSVARLGEVAPIATAAKNLIVLDHHADNERFGTVNVVLLDAAATAVVVRRLSNALGWSLDRDAAVNLYVGLVTDTGRFQYPNTTPDVFVLAEELSEYDLPLAAVTRELFEKHRFAYLRLAGLALARAQLDPDRRLVAAWITADELARYGVAFDETEGFVDLLRRTAEADVVVALKEAVGEGLRVSLRSLGAVDVGAVAAALGGGGHSFMAGFTTHDSVDQTLARIRALVPAHGS